MGDAFQCYDVIMFNKNFGYPECIERPYCIPSGLIIDLILNHMRAHFCRKMALCGRFAQCFVEFFRWVLVARTHYNDIIMGAIASQITSLMIVYSTVYSDADQRKHQSLASLAFVRGIHRGPVNSPHKWPVTRKMFPFDDVIMQYRLPLFNKPSTEYLGDQDKTRGMNCVRSGHFKRASPTTMAQLMSSCSCVVVNGLSKC